MIHQLFSSFKEQHIAVVGDIMLDTYWWGHTDRISPEAPVPVVALQNVEYRIGGAGNVALNLAALGAQVSMHSVTGDDDDGLRLESMMHERGINTKGVWRSDERETTNKIRVISRSQHLLRLDKETTHDLAPDAEERFIHKTIALFEAEPPAAVIFEDYNKGLLTPKVIDALIAWCVAHNIITAVDPKRKNFFNYKGVTIFKPNLKETKEALNLLEMPVTKAGMTQVHDALHKELHHSTSLITLSEKGMFYSNGLQADILPAHIRSIADVSGAGDTVIAVATLVFAATGNLHLMAEIANLAGGLVCEEVGTVAINPEKLLDECIRLLHDDNAQMSDG